MSWVNSFRARDGVREPGDGVGGVADENVPERRPGRLIGVGGDRLQKPQRVSIGVVVPVIQRQGEVDRPGRCGGRQ
jgi:hypothetical protein